MEDMIPQGSLTPHDGPGHESTDVGIRGILVFGLLLTLVIVLTMAILGGWYAAMAARERRNLMDRPPLYAVEDGGQFPPPILQADPNLDMIALAEAGRTRLNSYGWVDQEAGIARIPINRAIELALEQLDTAAPASTPTEPTTPTESRANPEPPAAESNENPDPAPAPAESPATPTEPESEPATESEPEPSIP